MKISVIFDVDDNFEPGQCDCCPLAYCESSFDEDDGYDYWYVCTLYSKCADCPLKKTSEGYSYTNDQEVD